MADDTIILTYRELADRLGISPEAARMKARRSAKLGRWSILAGNHPGDRVRVQLPAVDAVTAEPVQGERHRRSPGEQQGRTNPRTDPFASVLQSAQDRIVELTDQLTAEKDQHRETAIKLAELSAKFDAVVVDLVRAQDELEEERRPWWRRRRHR